MASSWGLGLGYTKMDDATREQIKIFLSHINKGVPMETTEIKTKVPSTGEKAIIWLKSVRIALDARVKFFEGYKELAGSQRYIALAVTSLERSRMFMGKLMGVYGSASPYKEGYNPESSEVISPIDVWDGTLPVIHEGQQIVHVKQARKDVATVIAGLEELTGHFPFNSNGNLFLTQVIIGLHDVTNWLGMELYSLTPPEALVSSIEEAEKEVEAELKEGEEVLTEDAENKPKDTTIPPDTSEEIKERQAEANNGEEKELDLDNLL